MRSHTVCCRVPHPLYNELRKICQERGYKNISRCMVGNSIIAVQNKRRAVWVQQIANAKPNIQDYLIQKLLAFPLDADQMLKFLKRTDEK